MGARCRLCRCLLMAGAWKCVNGPCSLLVCVSCMSSTGLPVKCPLPALKGSARGEAQLSQLLVQISDPLAIPTGASSTRLLPSLPLATAIPCSVVLAQGAVQKLGGLRRWQRRWIAAIPGAIIYWASQPVAAAATMNSGSGRVGPLSLPLQHARGILWLTPPLSFDMVGTSTTPPTWCAKREGAMGIVHGKGVLYLDTGSAARARAWASALGRAALADVDAAAESVGSARRAALRRQTATRRIERDDETEEQQVTDEAAAIAGSGEGELLRDLGEDEDSEDAQDVPLPAPPSPSLDATPPPSDPAAGPVPVGATDVAAAATTTTTTTTTTITSSSSSPPTDDNGWSLGDAAAELPIDPWAHLASKPYFHPAANRGAAEAMLAQQPDLRYVVRLHRESATSAVVSHRGGHMLIHARPGPPFFVEDRPEPHETVQALLDTFFPPDSVATATPTATPTASPAGSRSPSLSGARPSLSLLPPSILTAPYFRPTLTRESAASFLSPLPPGSYVLRPSTKEGCVVLSFVDAIHGGEPAHGLISPSTDSARPGWLLEGEPDVHETVPALLLSLIRKGALLDGQYKLTAGFSQSASVTPTTSRSPSLSSTTAPAPASRAHSTSLATAASTPTLLATPPSGAGGAAPAGTPPLRQASSSSFSLSLSPQTSGPFVRLVAQSPDERALFTEPQMIRVPPPATTPDIVAAALALLTPTLAPETAASLSLDPAHCTLSLSLDGATFSLDADDCVGEMVEPSAVLTLTLVRASQL